VSALLRLDGRMVAEYVIRPEVDPTLSPRPYLHPVRTLGGIVVTDAQPADHPHHLGVSVAIQDVGGTNLWGGRTYVRDTGYTWRDDHGQIVHEGFDTQRDDLVVQRLRWCDPAGDVLLTEHRRIIARLAADRSGSWLLDLAYTLTAPAGRDVTLGSPVTNGRQEGAGYGGLFWRAPLAESPPRVFTASGDGEDAVNGSTEPWAAITTDHYGLVFTGLGDGDHWFVRAAGYPGVCAALAYRYPRVIAGGMSLTRRHTVAIVDGPLDRAAVTPPHDHER
jgi:Methane oxygenase PmoA